MTIQLIPIHIALTFVLLLNASAASAGDFSTVFNGKSFHIGSEERWNEENYGLGFEYQFDSASRWKSVVMVNGFRDSVKNMSYMAGAGVHRNLFSSGRFDGMYVDLGLNAFVMTRQDINDGKPFPGALPSLTVGNRVAGVNLTYLPRAAIKDFATKHTMEKNLRGILYLQLKVNITELMEID